MSRNSLIALWVLLLSVGAKGQTTPVPHKLDVQGVLRNVAGEVISGTYTVTFRLWDAQSGGTNLYQEPQVLNVVGGVFSTYIGPVPTSVFIDRTDVWMGITVAPDVTELPRTPFTATGFAVQAEHAEEADTLLGAATDLQCGTTCVASNEVAFNWALGATKGGDAAGLTCVGCVTGGLTSDLGLNTITADNIADNAVGTGELAASAVTNAKLANNAVRSGNIEDGQVQETDLAAGAVTSPKIAAGAVTSTEVNFAYAGAATKGGAASDVQCSAGPGCVDNADVTFNYAGSGSKGGAANNLACADCVDSSEVAFNYAGSATEGGAALDTNCVGCISDTDVGIIYALGRTKGGAATDLDCTACVSSDELDFACAAADHTHDGLSLTPNSILMTGATPSILPEADNVATVGASGKKFKEFWAYNYQGTSGSIYKQNIRDLGPRDLDMAMGSIRNTRSVHFEFRNEDVPPRIGRLEPHIGVLAETLPPAVWAGGNDPTAYSLTDMDGLLVAGMKALDAENQELRARLDAAHWELRSMEERLRRLEERTGVGTGNGARGGPGH